MIKIDKFKNEQPEAYNEVKKLYDAGEEKKAVQVLMKYNVLDVNTYRQDIPIDRSKNNDLKDYDRLKAIATGRSLENFTASAKSMLLQFRLNVAGSIKFNCNSADEIFNKSAMKWFNSYYAKNCDFISDSSLVELSQNLISALLREGDTLIIFDSFIENSGRLKFYESDQLVTVQDKDWKEKRPDWCNDKIALKKSKWTGWKRHELKAYTQNNGIICNKHGQVKGYIVSADRGQSIKNIEDVTIIPAESAKLFKQTKRFNQYRGVSDLATISDDFQDCFEMRSKELQAAKISATFAGIIKNTSGTPDAILRASETLEEGVTTLQAPQANYEKFGSVEGGLIETMQKGDEFVPLNLDRPNLNAEAFYKTVNESAGASLGLSKAYSNMSAVNSYTAFRGDILLSWTQFFSLQKLLENKFLDWLAEKAILWAIDKNILAPSTDPLWTSSMNWNLPKMKALDELKTAKAKASLLKSGLTTFQKELGSSYKEILTAYSEEVKFCKGLGLDFLDIFESKAGALIETENNTENDSENDDDSDK